jgi:putative SOS response-associated peptidase YedK
MCGRYTDNLTWSQIVELYRLTMPDEAPPGLRPSYNVAPTHVMPIIRPAGNGRELLMAQWGLVPFWLQLAKLPYSTINARAESIRTAPTYREPFAERRCLVPASGWYEWQKISAKAKRPYHFKPKIEPFAFAGVHDAWKGDAGRTITSFAVITTDASPSVSQYHNRMPVVLEDSQFDDWIRGTPDQAAEMMKPYAGVIEAWEVGAAVGNVRNNRPELIDLFDGTVAPDPRRWP